ncbi:GbsR/MarR family transcriptional regulator [Pseudactinotalea suaedae]|uniref:GbsR/MarR family transcriptional regulator n=1 Tax=Pseudactinotalea suaedae TaxID=1524924 RepID=UPI0012E28B1F|nr:MarR family transcriptional regulator [Pseudactinotalea suaedae]
MDLSDKLTAAESAYVDEVAEFFVGEGLPLIAGRVIGWLLISDPAEQTPAQLTAALQVSRSSISSAMRLLTPSGLVERTRRRGDRNEYFRIAPDGWSRMLMRRYAQTTAFREVTERGLDLLATSGAERRERLEQVTDLYRFLETELPALLERWRTRQESS